MKFKLHFLAGLMLIITCGIFSGCEKAASSPAFGFNYIDIPQSLVSGGSSLNYLVPTGFDTNTFNFSIDAVNNKVNVFLGVSCSGKAATDGYSVGIATRTDTISQLISNSLIMVSPNPTKPVGLLPATAYSLPATVTVPDGQYAAPFYLTIDKTILKTYAGKKVALCVLLAGPTHYQLSPTNSQVIIIIDVDSLNLP